MVFATEPPFKTIVAPVGLTLPKSSVAPEATETVAEPSAPALARVIVPEFRVRLPESVLVPDKVRLPVPDFTKLPAPARVEAKVSLLPLVFTVRVTPEAIGAKWVVKSVVIPEAY